MDDNWSLEQRPYPQVYFTLESILPFDQIDVCNDQSFVTELVMTGKLSADTVPNIQTLELISAIPKKGPSRAGKFCIWL